MDGLLVPLIRTDPHIDPERWSDFRAGEIFNINSGKYVPTRDKKPGRTPEVTSSATNNGVSRFLDLPANFPGGSISVARNGSVGTAFYQPVPFFATDDVRVWTAMKGALSVWEALFVCAVIELEQPRYSYGRKWSLDQMRATNLRLPATDGGQPDWGLMADTIMGLKFSRALVD
ncbi:restriction endonuclease subunit S [Brachybacterium paraconglomeratum]